MGLGNTLTTSVTKPGQAPFDVVTNRILTPPPPETDTDFIDRHCLALLNALEGGPVSVLTGEALGLQLEMQEGWAINDMLREWKAQLETAS